MTIPFASIPSNLLVPFVGIEFDSSRAQQGPALLEYRSLIIGQKLAAGTAAANSLHRVFSADEVAQLAGRGSMLHRQARAHFANNKFTETWIGVLDDAPAGVAATGTITVTGPATAAGTIALYLGGELVRVAVAAADTADAIAGKIATAINAAADLPVTAVAAAAVVTVTHRHKGEIGNGYDLRDSYQDGEQLPAGVGLAYVAMAAGATNPLLTTLIAALGDSWFHVWAHGYTDATSLNAIEAELASRFGPMRMVDGVAVTSAPGTLGTLTALGAARNSPHSAIIAQAGRAPVTPASEFAAAVAAIFAYYGNIDPAQPFHTLQLEGVMAPDEFDRFTIQERQQLLEDGIATTRTGASGVVQLDGIVTTYKTNAAGAPDASYRYVNDMLTLMYLRYSVRTRFQTRYPRHKLADDGIRYGAGQAVITPRLAKAELVAWFSEMSERGLVEGMDQFKRDLIVERDPADRNRLNVLLPPDLVNQLVVTAINLQFRR